MKETVKVEVVDELPEKPVLGKIIYNKIDKCFYQGVDDKEEQDGSSLEKTSLFR